MNNKFYNVEIIGFGLALLYSVSCLAFFNYLDIPEFKLRTMVYLVLFGLLCVGSVAVILLREWGRKLLIVLSSVMLAGLAVRFLPQVDFVPLAYLFLNIIVLLYFTQSNIKNQFHSGRFSTWNRSVLIIDDDEGIIKAVRPILLSHGYSVLTALTGEDGLQIVHTQKPDLVLLDVILPGIKGREVCQKIKASGETRHIPVVFLTAKDSPQDVQAEQEAGSSGHLTKPVNARMLMETIHGLLDSKRDKTEK